MVRDFAGYTFESLGTIQPERDGRGALIEEHPRSTQDQPLHKHGHGPFCRFRIAQEHHWRRSGIYVLTCSGNVRYVGECKNLAKIWNSVGRIRPSAVRQGGQQTHCRINALILNEAKHGAEVILWFHAVDDVEHSARKARLVANLNPPWNRTSPRSPYPTTSRTLAQSPADPQPDSSSAARLHCKEDVAVIERHFGGRLFSRVGPIQPERDKRGKVVEASPQSRFFNVNNLPLHRYGEGPFCRFRIAQEDRWQRSGIYVLTSGYDPLYVGECQNLRNRWGGNGYGRISPRNCYSGGQETNCRINNLICRETKTGTSLNLWFYPIGDDKQARRAAESELVAALRPPWNR